MDAEICGVLLGHVEPSRPAAPGGADGREFDAAITLALADRAGMNIIRVHIGLEDRSTTLDWLAEASPRRSSGDSRHRPHVSRRGRHEFA